jgi:hypothetical protein
LTGPISFRPVITPTSPSSKTNAFTRPPVPPASSVTTTSTPSSPTRKTLHTGSQPIDVPSETSRVDASIAQANPSQIQERASQFNKMGLVPSGFPRLSPETLQDARQNLRPVSQHQVLNLGAVDTGSTTQESARSRKLGSEVGGVPLDRDRLPGAQGTLDIVGHSSDNGMKIEGRSPQQLASLLKNQYGLQQINTIHLVSCKSEAFKAEFQQALSDLGVDVGRVEGLHGKGAVDRTTGKMLDEAMVGDLSQIAGHDGGLGLNEMTLSDIAESSGHPIEDVRHIAEQIDTFRSQGTSRAEVEAYYGFLFKDEPDRVSGLQAVDALLNQYQLPPATESMISPLETAQQWKAIGNLDRVSVLKSLSQKIAPNMAFSQERYESDKPFNVLSSLHPDCRALLVDPGICSPKHLDQFKAFVELGDFADAWQAREAFSEALGTSIFHRAVTVTPEVMQSITQQGFKPTLFRELATSSPGQEPQTLEIERQPLSKVILSHMRDTSRTVGVPNPFTDTFQDFKNKISIMNLKAQLTIIPAHQPAPRLSIKERLAQPQSASRPARPQPDVTPFIARVGEFRAMAKDLSQQLEANGSDVALKYKGQLDQSIVNTENLENEGSFKPFLEASAIQLSGLFDSVEKASREGLIRPALRRQDPMQSLTQIEDIAKSVASNPDLTGVAADLSKKTYLVQLAVPNLDVLEPTDYVDRNTFPDVSLIKYPGQEPIAYEMSAKTESLIMGSIPASYIKGDPIEITNPPTIDSVYRKASVD